MPTVRRPDRSAHETNPAWFVRADSDAFTSSWFHEPLFASVEHARTAWPSCRRTVWAQTRRMTVPRPAETFDSLTRHGWHAVWNGRSHYVFPLAEVLAALDEDRAAVSTFEHRDRAGARDVRDFLELWRSDLDALERAARQCALDLRAFDLRPSASLTPAGCYGGAGLVEPDGF